MGGLDSGAVKKADSISAFATLLTLNFLALIATWITTKDTATPAALSTGYLFSHTPRPSGEEPDHQAEPGSC